MANVSRAGCCDESGCSNPIEAKRMCKAHYLRWWKAGRPEKIARYNEARRSAGTITRTCAASDCDETFTTWKPNRLYHSPACRQRDVRRRARARGAAWAQPPGWTDARRDAHHRRRARKKNQSSTGNVSVSEVYERDKWICQICQQPVDRTEEYPSPWSASLDHIVPLSLGGTHDPSNVELAHLRCNVRKSVTTDDQLRFAA